MNNLAGRVLLNFINNSVPFDSLEPSADLSVYSFTGVLCCVVARISSWQLNNVLIIIIINISFVKRITKNWSVGPIVLLENRTITTTTIMMQSSDAHKPIIVVESKYHWD